MRSSASPVERERDVRMLGVLVRTMRDLSLFDPGAPGEATPVEEDDSMPKDIEEFRVELARRIRGLVDQERQREQTAEPSVPSP